MPFRSQSQVIRTLRKPGLSQSAMAACMVSVRPFVNNMLQVIVRILMPPVVNYARYVKIKDFLYVMLLNIGAREPRDRRRADRTRSA